MRQVSLKSVILHACLAMVLTALFGLFDISFAAGMPTGSRVHGVVFADLSQGRTGTDPKLEPGPKLDMLKPLNDDMLRQLKEFLADRNQLKKQDLEISSNSPDSSQNAADLKDGEAKARTISALAKAILLPDITLQLRDFNGAVVSETTSDLQGAFDLPEAQKGTYELCWVGEGWLSECLKDRIVAADGPVFLPPLYVQPKRTSGNRAVAGRLLLSDRRPCRFLDLDVGVDMTGTIESNTFGIAPVRANSFGYYVLPSVPNAGLRVLGICGSPKADDFNKEVNVRFKSRGKRRFAIDETALNDVMQGSYSEIIEIVPSGADQRIDLTVANAPPLIIDFLAADGSALRGSAGSVIKLRALIQDSEDVLNVWHVTAGEVTVVPGTKGAEAEWLLPDGEGQQLVTLLATDGRGGWTRTTKKADVSSEVSLTFSGTVLLNGQKVASADDAKKVSVVVNGVEAPVNADGRFRAAIMPDKEERYVVTLSAFGFVTTTRVFHRASTGGYFDLLAAETSAFDPKTGGFVNFGEGQERKSTSIALAPDSLVTAETGAAPAEGLATISRAYLDPSQVSLSGDYDALGSDGSSQSLISFGAVFVEIRDAAGQKLQLANGKTAELSIAVPPDRLGGIVPNQIPVWTFDETTGFWQQNSQPAVRNGNAYRADVTHLSEINMDLGTSGNAACVRVQVDFLTTPADRILRVSMDIPTGGVQVKQTTLDNKLNAVYRLLPGATVRFELLRADGTVFPKFKLKEFNTASPPTLVDLAGNQIVLQVPADNMGSLVDLWPDEPYGDCKRLVVVTGDITQPADNFLVRKQAGVLTANKAPGYYRFMDPLSTRVNLEGWLTANGFQPSAAGAGFTFAPGANVVKLAYLNDGDLGSGRQMHCRKDADRVACMVDNFATGPDDNFNRDPDAADIAHASASGSGFAAVAMEYSAIEGHEAAGRIVKFFVFGSAPPRARVDLAQLDRVSGNRNHPNACMICHGGTVPSAMSAQAADVAALSPGDFDALIGQIQLDPSSFREFDLANLTNLQGSQPESKVRQLNCDYVLAAEPLQSIRNLINAWYNGGIAPPPGTVCNGLGGSAVQTPYVPNAWTTVAANAGTYRDVVAHVCQTCHVAQKNLDMTDPAAVWDSFMSTSSLYTCSVSNTMPQAAVTFNRYWTDGYHENLLSRYSPVTCP